MPDRDHLPPGATSIDLAPATPARPKSAADPYQSISRQAGPSSGPSSGIMQGTGADWFGPSNPLNPVAPPEIAGRRFDLPVGYNIEIVPRAYEAVSFWSMRNLAEAYDVLRLVIETRKDQMERLSWAIKPKMLASGEPAMPADAEVLQEITKFFDCPDPREDKDWGIWLRELLEDLFVIDAPTLYCRRDRSGKLFSLEQLDGATIKRVIDDWGRTPVPPVVAYQQYLKGLDAVNYTADDIIYQPRNSRVHKVYGYSPVEQVIMTVNIGLRRQLFTLQYYTEGNIPEALVGVPDQWTPTQISDFQRYWDELLTGNQAARRKIKFVPGGVAKTYIPTKEPELTGKLEEWIARVVCYCFSVSPTPFIQQVNRATAESAHDAALEEGLAPVQNWVKRLIDRIIRKFWPGVQAEFTWSDDREVDGEAQASILKTYTSAGIQTINETRDVLGLPPKEGGDELMALTGAGYVPINAPPPPEPAPGALPTHTGAPGAPGVPDEQSADGTPAAKPEEPAEPPATEGGKPKEDKPGPKADAKSVERPKGGAAKAANFRKSWWSAHRNAPGGPLAPIAGGRAGGKTPRT